MKLLILAKLLRYTVYFSDIDASSRVSLGGLEIFMLHLIKYARLLQKIYL